MPCGYVYISQQPAREREPLVCLHIFCVRLLRVCSFYCDGQCEGLKVWNEQTVRLSRFFIHQPNANEMSPAAIELQHASTVMQPQSNISALPPSL